MIFVTSDLHFNHDREFIYKPRGFESVQEMNEGIIERWNAVVHDDDIVYLLGDVCLGGGTPEMLNTNRKLIERLNGKIHIIAGNHDTDNRIVMYNTCTNVIDVKWADVLHYKKYHFYLSHYPSLTANLQKESLKQCTCNLYGHTHQNENFFNDIPFMYHVGVDSQNCYPVLLDVIIEEMEQKVIECQEQL